MTTRYVRRKAHIICRTCQGAGTGKAGIELDCERCAGTGIELVDDQVPDEIDLARAHQERIHAAIGEGS